MLIIMSCFGWLVTTVSQKIPNRIRSCLKDKWKFPFDTSISAFWYQQLKKKIKVRIITWSNFLRSGKISLVQNWKIKTSLETKDKRKTFRSQKVSLQQKYFETDFLEAKCSFRKYFILGQKVFFYIIPLGKSALNKPVI